MKKAFSYFSSLQSDRRSHGQADFLLSLLLLSFYLTIMGKLMNTRCRCCIHAQFCCTCTPFSHVRTNVSTTNTNSAQTIGISSSDRIVPVPPTPRSPGHQHHHVLPTLHITMPHATIYSPSVPNQLRNRSITIYPSCEAPKSRATRPSLSSDLTDMWYQKSPLPFD